ncbi:hypothetical protein AGABI1DRAFT_86788 [Agaricus bisporus var. burnettii JB137-S8]|uniref:Uncharacterized protein n=1 Tax=Agaricus bisporus var. burnettii (strain JB137-S8 / ATCC MYA-4627 / FGSC 10392) TaxID=597362 RepID=K5X279_AGABU|nr:uncharacterized protein AGABI1DRAFT_86788 [Agaricus bisporus var. burnettii JB137-S8]EKM77248.1 hypothetical protein AGABI1DRAFT_86788 [Agaricus bisporus var. burnettii JB137-S8]
MNCVTERTCPLGPESMNCRGSMSGFKLSSLRRLYNNADNNGSAFLGSLRIFACFFRVIELLLGGDDGTKTDASIVH